MMKAPKPFKTKGSALSGVWNQKKIGRGKMMKSKKGMY